MKLFVFFWLGVFLTPTSSLRAQTHVVDQIVAAGCGKDIVILGEMPSHGEAEAFRAKADTVTRLVESCGFNAVLFEAPIYEFEALRRSPVEGAHPPSALDDAIGGFWTTHELTEWRAWLARKASSEGLWIGGLDDQPGATSSRTRRLLPALISSSNSSSDGTMCAGAVYRHLSWSYSPDVPYDAAEKARLVACVEAAHMRLLAKGQRAEEAALVAAFYRYLSRQTGKSHAQTRDGSMLAAFKWHQAALPTGSRFVIWTSSVHAAREPGGRPYVPLGHDLSKLYGRRMLTVGFTAAAGMSSMAGTPPKPLAPLPPDSLEANALGRNHESVYLDEEALRKLDGKIARVYGTFASHSWAQHFDGVVVFRTEKAPTFPARK